MVSDRVEVNVIVKTDLTELQQAEIEAERVMTKMEKVITFVKTNSNKLMRSMQTIISLFSNILRTFGVALDPVGEALLGTIGVVIASVIQMQSILAAGTAGLSAAFGAAMVGAALAISVISTIEVARGMSQIKGQLAGALATTQSALSLFTIWN